MPSLCNKEYAPYVRFVRSTFKVGTDNLTTFHPRYGGRPGMVVGCCMAMAQKPQFDALIFPSKIPICLLCTSVLNCQCFLVGLTKKLTTRDKHSIIVVRPSMPLIRICRPSADHCYIGVRSGVLWLIHRVYIFSFS